ncbi:MAG: biopolymer transporter [Gammaproteobacteria bacterium RBG_16_57_12]|nr:MAG: biopolymer transporter [Gammaproteobacteria bacterium RBG_16_57_12]
MNFRTQRKEELDLNIAPLIDVVFLLLIFFMVSTTFDKQSEIKIVLPKATQQAQPIENDRIEISIDSEGQYYVNDLRVVNVQLSTLMKAMKEVAGNQKDPQLIIRADSNTPHQAVITAMDAARQLGFSRLAFATTHMNEGKAGSQ